MISNPNFIYYACIAKGTTILAHHHASKEPKIEELAAECLVKTPLHHSMFSHTVKKRTYTFSINDPFVYFAIFDEELVKSEARWFLDRIQCAFDEILKSRPTTTTTDSDDFTHLCFQAQFEPIFRESTIARVSDLENPSQSENKDEQKRSVMAPLLSQPIQQTLKKKKRVSEDAAMENKLDVCDDINGCPRDFALSVPKGGINDRQKAKQIWKKHVWVVLLLDVFVCAMLFAIWLWVCRGFRCMRS